MIKKNIFEQKTKSFSINRRYILKMAAKILGTSVILGSGLPVIVLASPNNEKESFKVFSQLITGFFELDETLIKAYREEIETIYSKDFVTSFLTQFQKVLNISNDSDIDEMIHKHIVLHPKYSSLSHSVLMLWYTGSLTPSGNNSSLRALAFIQSLQWQTAGVTAPSILEGPTWHLPLSIN